MKAEAGERRILIDLARLKAEGERFTGEADAIDLEEEFVHPFGGIRYDLTAQLLGTELLVRGRLEQDFDLVCSRCGRDFDTTVKVEDYTASMQVAEHQREADLTADARESIILTLPAYPVCDLSCPGVPKSGGSAPADTRWAALDALDVR